MSKRLSEADRMAILTARAAGVPVGELARRYHVTRQTISTVLSRLKEAKYSDAKAEFDAVVYRSRLRRKAFVAVEAGLDCTEDQYKRGNLGAVTLKGLGDFQPDSSDTLNVLLLSNARLPDDLKLNFESRGDFVDVTPTTENRERRLISTDDVLEDEGQ